MPARGRHDDLDNEAWMTLTERDLAGTRENSRCVVCSAGSFRPWPVDLGFKTAGDCPDFAQSSEQNETVPLSEAVLKPRLVSDGPISIILYRAAGAEHGNAPAGPP